MPKPTHVEQLKPKSEMDNLLDYVECVEDDPGFKDRFVQIVRQFQTRQSRGV